MFVDDTFRPANIFKRGNGMWHLTSNFLKHATVFYINAARACVTWNSRRS